MALFDLKRCNESRYKKRADYGIRVARPGYDANNCEQNQLIFNSNWPIIQIAKIIDIKADVPKHEAWTQDSGRTWADTPPEDVTFIAGEDVDIYVGLSVGKNYVYVVTRWEIYTDLSGGWWSKYEYKKIKHGMGYCPMFYRSEALTDEEGYIFITSFDLTVDIDYPYTEGPTMFVGSASDYGIKSASAFGRKVPGLSSNMFSRLIQAVKTQDTSKAKYNGIPLYILWSPLKKMEKWERCLTPFEAEAFSGYNNPFRVLDYNIATGDMYDKYGDDGPYYCDHNLPIRAETYDPSIGSGNFGDGVAFTTMGQSAPSSARQTMVISRSPMVSPEYEEVEI